MARIGILSKFYVNDGTYATPVWVEVKIVGDLAVNGGWEEGDATTRESVVAMSEPTRLPIEITGRLRSQTDNAAYGAIRDAFIGRTELDVMALNGASTENGSEGYRFDGKVFNFGEDQALGNVLYRDFNIKPCPSVNSPKYVIVAAGAPTYLALGTPPA